MTDTLNIWILIGIVVIAAWIIIPDPLEFLDIILIPILGLLVLAGIQRL